MNQERLFKVLLGPQVTEKAASAAESSNTVVFKVTTDSTKLEVKAAIEKLFEVKVESVRILNVKGKTKRTRHGLGKRNDWKKAYVRLVEGQDIDFSAMD